MKTMLNVTINSMGGKAGAGEKLLLFGRNISFLGAAVLAAVTLLPGAQLAFANAAANFLALGVSIEATRQITNNIRTHPEITFGLKKPLFWLQNLQRSSP